MHVNILGIAVSVVSVALIVGVPAAFAVKLWKYLGRR